MCVRVCVCVCLNYCIIELIKSSVVNAIKKPCTNR